MCCENCDCDISEEEIILDGIKSYTDLTVRKYIICPNCGLINDVSDFGGI
jgi:hypothetical protein